jgi:hypothetical protein
MKVEILRDGKVYFLTVEGDKAIAFGDTFDRKEEFSEMGMHFNREQKIWTKFSDEQIARLASKEHFSRTQDRAVGEDHMKLFIAVTNDVTSAYHYTDLGTFPHYLERRISREP